MTEVPWGRINGRAPIYVVMNLAKCRSLAANKATSVNHY